MKITYERDIADETPCSILDAIAYACQHPELWHIRKSKRELLAETRKTDLEGKCGGCRHSAPMGTTCYVTCAKGYVCRPRSQKCCKQYEGVNE